MDIERSLCQQLCPIGLDEAISVLVTLWKLLFSKRSCLCARLLVKHLWVRLYSIKKLPFVFFLSIWYRSKAMSFYLFITVNLCKKLVTHPSTMVCLCIVYFLTWYLNKKIEPGFSLDFNKIIKKIELEYTPENLIFSSHALDSVPYQWKQTVFFLASKHKT